MAAFSAAAACTDKAATFQVGNLRDLSDWYEFDATGHQLVHESGTLTGPELAVDYPCGNWLLAAQVVELEWRSFV